MPVRRESQLWSALAKRSGDSALDWFLQSENQIWPRWYPKRRRRCALPAHSKLVNLRQPLELLNSRMWTEEGEESEGRHEDNVVAQLGRHFEMNRYRVTVQPPVFGHLADV